MSEERHTPLPWHYQELSDAYTHIVRGPKNELIAQLAQDTSGKAEADARMIVESVNNHGELLKAIEKALECANGRWCEWGSRAQSVEAILTGALSAIQAAKGVGLSAIHRYAEQLEIERDQAIEALRVLNEETVLAGFPGGDREQTLANVRAMAAQLGERSEIIKQLVAALEEFMDVWNSGDATKVGQRAMQRRADMWDKAKAALNAAKGAGL